MAHRMLVRAALCMLVGLTPLAPSSAAAQPSPSTATAQAASQLVVEVRDNWGVIPSATVRVVNRETGASTRALTDGTGKAVLEGLAPGTYDVSAGMEGFVDSLPVATTLGPGASESTRIVLSQVQFSETVTVSTPARRQELLLNVADPVLLLEGAQIQDTGARTSKDLLIDQGGSGVQVNAGGGQGYVSINGIPNSGVLMLQDGRRVLGKDANGNLNLEDFEMTGVDRVEVVKGAGSALYGSDALGGVVNIMTRQSPPGVSNTLQATGGSYDDYRVTDTFGYRRGPGGFSAGAGYRTYDGFDLSPTDPATIGQPESEWNTYNLNGDIRPAGWLAFRGFGNYQNRKIDNYYFRGPTNLGGVYNSKRDLTRYMIAPDADMLFGPNTTVTLSYTYAKYDREETQVYPSTERVQVPWLEWNQEFKLTGRQTWRAMGQEQYLQAGYEFRRETLDRASLKQPETGERKQARDINVFWLQQEFLVGPRLRTSIGFRYDNYQGYGDRWSPKLTASYALTDRQRARFTYGQGFRAPYFNELYLYTPPFFVGNPNLVPEESNSYTAGYVYASSALQASADYFFNQVENGITFDLSKLPYTYVNLRRYDAQGVNTALSVNLPWGFVPSVSYTYVTREDDQGREVGGLPKDAVYVKLLWNSPRYGLRANLRAQFLSDVTFDDGTSQPGYQVWRGQVGKRFVPRAGSGFTVFAQVDNIFNEEDIFRRGTDGQPIPGDFQVWLPPRTFLLGITFDVNVWN